MNVIKDITVGEVALIQIITGEVVMGKVQSLDDGVNLEKPMSLIMNPMQGGIGMIPHMAVYLGKELEEITIKESHVVYSTTEFMDDFKAKYQEYLTGIIAPTSADIIQ